MKLIKLFPILLFAFLSLVIVFPLLPPGYILTMDIAFTPKLPVPVWTSSTFFFGSLLWLLNLFIPSFVLQKIMLFLVFFLAGWGMYRLIAIKYGRIGFFGGIFYAINPFVYERVMAGQWQFLLGYSLLPFVISSIIDFFNRLEKKNTLFLALWTLILLNLVVHFSLILVAMILIYGAIHAYFHQEKIPVLMKRLVLFGVIAFLFNINWLLPAILGLSGVSQTVGAFDSSDLTAFQSVPDKSLGLIFNLLSGFGFWPEAYDYFVLSKNVIFFWPLLSILVIILSFLGVVKIFQEKEKKDFPLILTLIILFILSLDLAGGVALKSSANIFYFLYDRFVPLRGLREPQKLVGIIMFCYAFFGSIGISSLLEKIKREVRHGVMLLLIILPIIYTPTVFGGFWGQLKPIFYPDSWQEVNRILREDKDDFLTLFFPWHQYTRFKFVNDRVVANPAVFFFDKPILSSQNYETDFLYSHDTRPEAFHVEGLLSIENDGVNLLGDRVDEKVDWAKDLAVVNVKYIILSKSEDWKKYDFLNRTADLEKILEEKDLVLYKNRLFGQEITYPQEDNSSEPPPVVDKLINN